MSSDGYYLNTDLELTSSENLSALAAFLQKKRWSVHHNDWLSEGCWLSTFEHSLGHRGGPDEAARLMLKALEHLPETLMPSWTGCSARNFNIGYQSGAGGRPIEQTLSNEVLKRIAAIGGSITVTIYAYDPALCAPGSSGPG